MADKEERIYICSKEKVCQICKDNCAEFDGIVPCGNCGYEDFHSMTRQDAIEVMAKAICLAEDGEGCEGKCPTGCSVYNDRMRTAEAALNALLGVEK